MADATKLRRLRRAGLGAPPSSEEARSDLTPELPSGEREIARPSDRRDTTPKAVRIDGRTLRRSGRTVQFATRVSPEFDERIRNIARREGKLLVEVLEQALDAYEDSR